MKRSIILYFALCIVGGYVVYQVNCSENLYYLSTTSPQNTYKIQLNEKITEYSDKNLWPIKIFLRLEKQNNIIVDGEVLYDGDDWDARFGQMAPESEWITEHILRLSHPLKGYESRPHDYIEFRNYSEKTIDYAFIRWSGSITIGQNFLVVDMKPGDKYQIKVISEDDPRNHGWVSCKLRIKGEDPYLGHGINFNFKEKTQHPMRYYITLTKDMKTLIEENPKW